MNKKYIVRETIVVPMFKDESKVPTALENGFVLKFVKNKEGISFFEIVNAYSILLGGIVCLNEEQVKALEEVKDEVTADAEELAKDKEQNKVYKLDPEKTYSGDEGIDYIILYLQNTDLGAEIKRDDTKALFVDLGEIKMFPDAEKTEWIMKLNARIPIRSALSVGCRLMKGVKHFGVVLHDSFV